MDVPLQLVFGAVLPVMLVLGIGFWMRGARMLTAEADGGLTKLVIRLLYPCFFFNHVAGNPVLADPAALLLPPLVGFAGVAGGFAIAFAAGRLLGLRTGKGLRTFAMCNGIYNYGYIPIPLVMALFASRETTAVLLLHNIGVEIAMWSVGILLLTGVGSVKLVLQRVVNPPLIALGLALALTWSGAFPLLPQWIPVTIEMLGNCAIPLGLLLAGAAIRDLFRQGGLLQEPLWPMAAIGLRLGLLPALFVAAAAFSPWMGEDLRRVLVVQAAMPAGIFPIVLARHYGGDPTVAVRVVIATTLAAALTLPLWIRYGLLWIS
jgi:predicted permease